MSERFEQAVQDWYDKSRTANLSYLNLETKPTLPQLANNLDVVYDRLNLLSRVSLKQHYKLLSHFEKQTEEIRQLQRTQKAILEAIAVIQKELISQKPLTSTEVKNLTQELVKLPKLIEQQTSDLLKSVKAQVDKVEKIISTIHSGIS